MAFFPAAQRAGDHSKRHDEESALPAVPARILPAIVISQFAATSLWCSWSWNPSPAHMRRAYPNISIDIHVDDAPGDLATAGFDAGIAIGELRLT